MSQQDQKTLRAAVYGSAQGRRRRAAHPRKEPGGCLPAYQRFPHTSCLSDSTFSSLELRALSLSASVACGSASHARAEVDVIA